MTLKSLCLYLNCQNISEEMNFQISGILQFTFNSNWNATISLANNEIMSLKFGAYLFEIQTSWLLLNLSSIWNSKFEVLATLSLSCRNGKLKLNWKRTFNVFNSNLSNKSHGHNKTWKLNYVYYNIFKERDSLKTNRYKTGVINDPLGQTHFILPEAITNFTWKLFCFAIFWKVEKDGRTDTTSENSDHYRPWLWVGLVDH